MKQCFLLIILSILCIPCWLGTVGLFFCYYTPMIPPLNWSEVGTYLSLFAYILIMVLPCIPVVVFSRRVFMMIVRADAGRGVCSGNRRSVAFAIIGVVFWGFWTRCALAMNEFAVASWRDLWRSQMAYEYVFQSVCIVLAYVTPMVTTAYFVALLFHRIADLLKRRKVADRV